MDRQKYFSGQRMDLGKEINLWGKEIRVLAGYQQEDCFLLDLAVPVSEEEIRRFAEKWNLSEEHNDCEAFTAEELEEMDQESPFSMPYTFEAAVNGKTFRANQSSGSSWNPAEGAVNRGAEKIMNEYGLDRGRVWNLCRVSFPRKSEEGKMKTVLLNIRLQPTVLRGPCFTVDGCGREFSFRHPVTGKNHTVQICSYEPGILEDLQDRTGNLSGFEVPRNYVKIGYRIEPEIPIDSYSLTDFSRGDCLRKRECRDGQKNAVSVSLIGGQDGPTAVFLAGKMKEKDDGMKTVYSSVHFEPVEEVKLIIKFILNHEEVLTAELL